MRELIELNLNVLLELPVSIREDDLPQIHRDTGPELWPGASMMIRLRAEAVWNELLEYIPEDIYFSVYLGGEKPELIVSVENGTSEDTLFPIELDEEETIASQLGSMDWEQLQEAETERARNAAAGKGILPIQNLLPPTKKLQQIFREDMKYWLKQKRRDSSKIHVFAWREMDEFKSGEFATLDELTEALPEIIAVELQVIAIVADGKPLPVKVIDQMKGRAIETMLEQMPISLARAAGMLNFNSLTEREL